MVSFQSRKSTCKGSSSMLEGLLALESPVRVVKEEKDLVDLMEENLADSRIPSNPRPGGTSNMGAERCPLDGDSSKASKLGMVAGSKPVKALMSVAQGKKSAGGLYRGLNVFPAAAALRSKEAAKLRLSPAPVGSAETGLTGSCCAPADLGAGANSSSPCAWRHSFPRRHRPCKWNLHSDVLKNFPVARSCPGL